MLASLRYWPLCREESCSHPEASTSCDRLLPPAWAQGIGPSCGFDRSSQGSPGPRSPEETHAFLSDTRRTPRLPVSGLRRSSMAPTTSLDRIGVGIDTARYGHRVSFLRPDRQPVAQPLTVLENRAGYQALEDKLMQLREKYPDAPFHVRIDAA